MNNMTLRIVILVLFVCFRAVNCDLETLDAQKTAPWYCADEREETDDVGDLLFRQHDFRSKDVLSEKRNKSRVCLPQPCENVEAYSGFINVDRHGNSSFLFFLHVKSQGNASNKPLLLWLQGGPGKSSLFGQFLENGPLGIAANGELFYRNHTILNYMNIIYLDQPTGSGYSFNNGKYYASTLENASLHIMWFMRRFTRLFPEYVGRDFYIAGESYGARFAIGVASKLLKGEKPMVPLKLKGVMLGVGFLFPLLNIIDSTDYLFSSGILNNVGKSLFTKRFTMIRQLVQEKNYSAAAGLLSHTVMNIGSKDRPTLFQSLTGFKHHGSIARAERNEEIAAYYNYANDSSFKKVIHVNSNRVLDGTRRRVVEALALGDFFQDHRNSVEYVFNRTHVLFYTGQFDAVFPEMNIEKCFRKLQWRGVKMFDKAERVFWHRENDTSLELLGYERTAGALTYANVLFGGHYISLDRSYAVSELYRRFLTSRDQLASTTTEATAC
uniref:Tick serine protease n=1 Tax=Rhipicephalus zambeziensis TaxID=60191 RepID=A0A224YH60_9ACAR